MTATCTNTPYISVKPTGYSPYRAFRLITGMLQAGSQRRELAQLDTARLEDMGLSFDQANTEAKRPFWDVPAHWKQ